MAMVACAECGLPRVESELGTKPCPVCAAAPVTAVPRAKKAAEPDPTAGMAADASQLYTDAPRAASGSRFALGAVAFALGVLCGGAGLFAVQSIGWPKGGAPEAEAAAAPKDESPEPSNPAPATPEVKPAPKPPESKPTAPKPPEPAPKSVAGGPSPTPEPGDAKQIKLPAPGQQETHAYDDPAGVYSVPALTKGEYVVLKGKVMGLRVHGLDAGATLDASELDASQITVTGRIDGASKLLLRAPGGTVHFSGAVDGKSEVTVAAAAGTVKFLVPTAEGNEGSKIDGGSKVTITGRTVEFKGDIAGDGTKVSVNLTRNAWLKFASLSGKATLEYRLQVVGQSPPDVVAGKVAPGATFRSSDRNDERNDDPFGPQ